MRKENSGAQQGTGMISPDAVWICHPDDTGKNPLIPVFRKSFEVKAGLLCASMAVTSHGIYHTEINGEEVTDHRFTPGFTSYYHRIQYQTYDITNLVNEGINIWQTAVGDGWWRWHSNFGYTLALKGEITLCYENETVTIPTDTSFDVTAGKVISSDYLKGEVYDCRIELNSWIKAAKCHEHTEGKLIETEGVPVREHEVFEGKPFKDASGNLVIDFDQNIAGYVSMKLFHTKPGQTVRLKHGEGLDLNGSFSTANCDGGLERFQEITYICKGAKIEEYKPYFTWFGFRYVLVEGIEDAEFKAIAVYSDMEETGDFRCSSELINKLVENARWSQKGNFLDVATDCPTREKNAWTGDAAIYCRTSAWFMNVKSFYEKWLKDQAIEQFASGKLGITFPSTSSVHNPEELIEVQKTRPDMALAGPEGEGNIGEDSVGWGDSSVVIPYELYQMYGDETILANHYETAKRWISFSLDCMKETNPLYKEEEWYKNGEGDLIYDTRFHYGEWNEPLPPAKEVIELFANGGKPEDFVRHMAKYGKPETATACTKHSCDLLAYMAEVLGKTEDAKFYKQKAASLKYAYDRYLIAEDGTIQKGHQAAYVRALAYDMVSEEKKPLVIRQLKKEIEVAEYHLNTGFLSTGILLPVLCDSGLKEEAFKLLEQKAAPSWLHPVTLGATTMLENWNGMDVFRDSFNHYSLGAVCQFLFEYVAGIRPVKPGFKKFELSPVTGGSLTWAEGSYKTQYGTILSRWQRDGNHVSYMCQVPSGTEAHLTLPDNQEYSLTAGTYHFQFNLQNKEMHMTETEECI